MRFVAACFLLLPFFASSQNLLPNGGFEDENICTEYGHNCAPEAWIATSLKANYYFDDAPHANTGTHFIGLIAGDLHASITKPVRVFIRSRLICGLRRGSKYKLEFYLRSESRVLDSVGVYFSSTDFLYERRTFKDINPALWVKDGMPEDERDTPASWHKASFIYTATGDEEYILIGNFKRGEYSNIRSAEFASSYYFFLDDISLTPLDPHEKLCLEADSVKAAIYDQNERHNLLDKKIYLNTRHPPAVVPLPVTVIQRIDTLVIPDILFATNSYALTPKADALLDSFSTRIKNDKVDSLVVEGHTDSTGSVALNKKLSENRAASVASYLQKSVTVPSTITRGWASEKPVADNKTAAGRQKNRRVEIYLYVRDPLSP